MLSIYSGLSGVSDSANMIIIKRGHMPSFIFYYLYVKTNSGKTYFYLLGTILSTPPIYIRSGSGIRTEPSS